MGMRSITNDGVLKTGLAIVVLTGVLVIFVGAMFQYGFRTAPEAATVPGTPAASEEVEVTITAPATVARLSAADCGTTSHITFRTEALLSKMVPAVAPFATQLDGERAIDNDLSVFDQILTLTTEPADIEDRSQRGALASFHDTVRRAKTLIGERRGEDMTKSPTSEWTAHMAEILRDWTRQYSAIKAACGAL